MKLSLLSLATLVGAAVADLDPIIIKVIFQTHQTGLKGGLHINVCDVNRAPSSSTLAMILNCTYIWCRSIALLSLS